MVMSDQGKVLRQPVAGIRRIGRNTQGVRLINLMPEQRLIGVVRIPEDNTHPATDASATLTDAAVELDADIEAGDEPEDSLEGESSN
jgi:DNA gyrase subunit A